MMSHKHIVTSSIKSFPTYCVDLFSQKNLIYWMIIRYIRQVFGRSIVGPAWLVFRTLVTAIMMSIVFTYVVKVDTETPYLVFYLSGMLPWVLFSSTTNFMGRKLRSQRKLMQRTSLSRDACALSVVGMPLAEALSVAIVLFGGICVYSISDSALVIELSPKLLLLPVLLCAALVLGLGIGMIAGMLNLLIRDIIYIIPFVMSILMYATPILYPLKLVPEAWHMPLLVLNPMASIIEGVRWTLLPNYHLPEYYLLMSLTLCVVLFSFARVAFEKGIEHVLMPY